MTLTAWAAFFLAVLAGMGVGSAGLFVLFLTWWEKLPQITAQALNLLFFLCASGAALLVQLFQKPPTLRLLLFLLPAGVLGAWLGAWLAGFLPQQLLRRIFGIFLILSGCAGFFAKK